MAKLQWWGARMTQPPTSYTFRKKFLDGLSMALIDKMIDWGASPNLAKLSKMVRTLQCIEENNALKDYYVKSSKKMLISSFGNGVAMAILSPKKFPRGDLSTFVLHVPSLA